MKQKFFPGGEPKSMHGNIADYVKMEKTEKPTRFFVVCPVCGYIRANKRWYWAGDVKEAEKKETTYKKCPGCEAVENGWIEGEITLKNKIVSLVPDQIERILKNLEEEFRQEDPKNRIVKIQKTKNFWKVYTASVFLAHQIGEKLERTYTSKVSYKFSKGEKYVRVLWEDQQPKKQ